VLVFTIRASPVPPSELRSCRELFRAKSKAKGELAELKVACDLVMRGYQVAIPFGEDSDFDLIVIRHGSTERVQVKHSASKDG
jgi:PD-(D/E)XK endonuclease